MNILSKVTCKTLVKNRVRTVVTVIGIILSAAMFTAVTVSVSSFQHYLQNVMRATMGDWHGVFYNMTPEDLETLRRDDRVDDAWSAQVAGWVWDGIDEEDRFPYIQVLGLDDTFLEHMPVTVREGRLPESPDEIMIYTLMLAGETRKIGDTVTLTLGERYLDGVLLDAHNPYVEGEEFVPRETRTYTIVGIMSHPQYESGSLPGYILFTRRDPSAVTLEEGYFTLRDPKEIYDFQISFLGGRYGSADNDDYLMTLGLSRFDTFYTVLYGFAAILIGLILFGSVSLIYNAFSISVAERTRQFGLLRSVGATRRQIRSMVVDEAAAVSAVGIPLGVLSGILGMGVTFHFIGDALSDFFLNEFEGGSVTLRLYVSPLSIIAAVLIGLVTVLISAWVPSRRAMRVSAIDAIRQSGDVRVRRREVRTSPLTYRLFGLEGAIAGKHFKRDRRRYRATVVSLFMSVVLFISASSFCRYMTDSVKAVFEQYDYDICFYGFSDLRYDDGNGERSEDMGRYGDVLGAAQGVSDWSAMKEVGSAMLTIPRDMMPEETARRIWPDSENETELLYYAHIYGVENDTYRRYLAKMGLPEEEYMGEDPKLILRASVRAFDSDTQRMVSLPFLRPDAKALDISVENLYRSEEFYTSDEFRSLTEEERDRIEIPDFYEHHTYEIGLITDELPLGLNGANSLSSICVLMPEDEARRIDGSFYDNWSMYFNVTDRENGVKNIVSAANAAELSLNEDDLVDIYDTSSRQRALIMVVNVISYGFITLISAIAAVNVFNTVSTNILLRRREFAMLRSVGMTKRGLNKMMNFECLLYGTKALLFGIPAAFGVTYLIFRTVRSAMDTDFYLPWSAVAIAVGSVFLVVFLSMMFSMSGIKRDNPIEAMKNEVI